MSGRAAARKATSKIRAVLTDKDSAKRDAPLAPNDDGTNPSIKIEEAKTWRRRTRNQRKRKIPDPSLSKHITPFRRAQDKISTSVKCNECGQEKKIFRRRMCRSCFTRLVTQPNQLRAGVKCPECKKPEIAARGLCKACYRRLVGKPNERRPGVQCRECKKQEVWARGMCRPCHRKMVVNPNAERRFASEKCRECGERKINARGLCSTCYFRFIWTPTLEEKKRVCVKCKRLGIHAGHGLCRNCHGRFGGKMVVCKCCGETKRHQAHGLCKECYVRTHLKRKEVVCRLCGATKIHKGHGLCGNCYSRDCTSRKKIECASCGEMQLHKARGLCEKCYERERSRRRRAQARPKLRSSRARRDSKEVSTSAQDANDNDSIYLRTASENETDEELSSGDEDENYEVDVKPHIKQEIKLDPDKEAETPEPGMHAEPAINKNREICLS